MAHFTGKEAIGTMEDEQENRNVLPKIFVNGRAAIVLLVTLVLCSLPIFDRMAIAPTLYDTTSRDNETKHELSGSKLPSSRIQGKELPEIAWLMTYPNSVGP